MVCFASAFHAEGRTVERVKKYSGNPTLIWMSCKRVPCDSPFHHNPGFQDVCYGDCARELLSFVLTLLAQIRNQDWHPDLPKLDVEEPGHDHG
jgi:hypothetical protein